MVMQDPIAGEAVVVHFRLPASIWADTVHLVGDFNGWSKTATPMRRGEQYWEVSLTLTAGCTYAYAYLLDVSDWCSEHYGVMCADALRPPITLLPVPVAQARRLAMEALEVAA